MRNDIKKPNEERLSAQEKRLAAPAKPGGNTAIQENHHDIQTTATARSTPESVAGKPRGRSTGAGGVSPTGVRFTLSSMALANEPVNPQRLAQLLN